MLAKLIFKARACSPFCEIRLPLRKIGEQTSEKLDPILNLKRVSCVPWQSLARYHLGSTPTLLIQSFKH